MFMLEFMSFQVRFIFLVSSAPLKVVLGPVLVGGVLLGRGDAHPVGALPEGGGRDPVHLGRAREAHLLRPAKGIRMKRTINTR
jgi:hypothetical protein